MTARRRNLLFVLSLAVLLALPAVASGRQQPAQPPAQTPPPAQAQAPPQHDVGAQIDDLLKQEIQLVNVQGRLNDALSLAQQAVALSQKLGDKKRLMRSLDALGSANFYLNHLQESLDIGRQEEELARELNDTFWLCRTFNGMATVLRNLGQYEEALSDYNQSLALARQLNHLQMEWALQRNIGVLYLEMSEPDRAETPLKQSLVIARQLDQEPWKSKFPGWGKIGQAASLETLGNWEIGRKHFAAAIDFLQQSLVSSPDNPAFKAEILINLAAAYELSGDSQKSIEIDRQAIQLGASTGSTPNPVIVSNLAFSQEHLGQLDQAFAGEKQALAMVRQSGGNPEYDWFIQSRLAHLERAMGRNQQALADYQSAVETVERSRAGALNTELGRASVLEKSHAVYAETADLLFDLHRPGDALQIAERGRARAFLDILAQSRAGLADELTPDQRQREDAILARISAAQKALWRENVAPDEQKKSRAALEAAEDDLEAFHLAVRQSNPRYASIRYPEPISVDRLQNTLLDDHTALVEYLLGEKRSLVWVVTRNGIQAMALPSRKEIESQVAAYRDVLTRRASALTLDQSVAEIDRLGAQLYRSWFLPIQPAVAADRTLIIVPDGVLNYLPFEALVTDSRTREPRSGRPAYLGEKFVIVYGPSASALVTVRALNRETKVPPQMLVAFGDPVWPTPSRAASAASADLGTRAAAETRENSPLADYAERGFSFAQLPYSRREVLDIGGLFPASERRLFLGTEATEAAVEAQKLDQFRYIHFATHSFIDESNPALSGILLSRAPGSSESGILQMNQIMRLKLNADLVTLSACSTGLGKLENGEGILGLTRVFFYAGARNLTVSLWNVNDSATAALMRTYYQNLNRGLSEGEALRRAKLSMLRGKIALWRHPYFWAPFVLVGEGN